MEKALDIIRLPTMIPICRAKKGDAIKNANRIQYHQFLFGPARIVKDSTDWAFETGSIGSESRRSSPEVGQEELEQQQEVIIIVT